EPQLVVVEIRVTLLALPEVLLDRKLVLRGGRVDARTQDRADLVDLVAVVEEPPRRLGRAVADAPPGFHGHRGTVRLLVAPDERQRFLADLYELNGANDDALERVVAPPLEPGGARGVAR